MSWNKGLHYKLTNKPIDPNNKYIGFYSYIQDTMAGEVELSESPKGKLYFALINLDKRAWSKNLEECDYEAMVRTIARRFYPYVPEEVRITDNFNPLSKHHHEEESRAYAKDFVNFMIGRVNSLEDYLTREYFYNGKKKDLDILERRYKDNWSNQPVKSIEVKQSDKQDNKIEISIVDA